jgi:hypothetical protein
MEGSLELDFQVATAPEQVKGKYQLKALGVFRRSSS